jgi:hypothetical protein
MGCGGRAFGQQSQSGHGFRPSGSGAPALARRQRALPERAPPRRFGSVESSDTSVLEASTIGLRPETTAGSGWRSLSGPRARASQAMENDADTGLNLAPPAKSEGTPRGPRARGWGDGRAALPSGKEADAGARGSAPSKGAEGGNAESPPSPRGGRGAPSGRAERALRGTEPRSCRWEKDPRSQDPRTTLPSGG